MLSKKLKTVRSYELEHKEQIEAAVRPVFHFTSPIGWLNDPNGFSEYAGNYHLFFQYHPYSLAWGPMHWGHAVSKDFVNWQYLPCALAPDTEYDSGGCFSGSAFTSSTGKHVLVYTNVHEKADATYQEQSLAIGDGLNYEKFAENPILSKEDLPKQYSAIDFRDPKVSLDENGAYNMVTVSRKQDNLGAILLFKSEEGKDFKFISELAANQGDLGVMWECPDLFNLAGEDILIFSAQSYENEALNYQGDASFYIQGEFDGENFRASKLNTLDYGYDFYAPQTLKTQDGRRVMIAWMQNWQNKDAAKEDALYFGQMTCPRELVYEDNELRQKPVRELKALRKNQRSFSYKDFSGEQELAKFSSKIFDLELQLKSKTDELNDFKLELYEDLYLEYSSQGQKLKLYRSLEAAKKADMQNVYCDLSDINSELSLRILKDRNSIEIFINGGKKTITALLENRDEKARLKFSSKEDVDLEASIWDLEKD